MRKLLILALALFAAWPAAAEPGIFKLSLWDKTAIASPDNIHDITGIDLGIGSKTETLSGVQLDLIFAQTEYELKGVSFAWIINLANDVYGAQFGLLAKAENIAGAQFGFVNMSNREISGLQFGLFNQAEYIHGAQIGFVNYARTIEGLQVGILNIAENGWFPAMVLVNGRF